jgi:hypothetical protein
MKFNYLELLVLLLPSLLIFITVYVLFRQFFNNQLRMRMMNQREKTQESTVPLKLQAYERLTLFCERISMTNLILRLKTKEVSARDLKAALILAIQQEYEHNVSQQLYTSDQLWQIVQLAKNQQIELIAQISDGLAKDASSDDLARQLVTFQQTQKTNPVATAKSAIKKEAGLLL